MGSYDTMIVNDGACSYWRLDRATDELSNLADSLKAALTSSNVSSGGLSLLPGTNNSDVDTFNGSSSYVWGDTNHYHALDDTLAIEAWIKTPSSVDSSKDVVAIAVKNGSYGLMLSYGQLAFFTRVNGGSNRITASGSVASASTIYHVCGTYDAGTGDQKLYVNGSLITTTSSLSGSTDQNSAGFVIGSWDTSTLFFSGDISNVAAYAFALGSTAIGNHAGYTG